MVIKLSLKLDVAQDVINRRNRCTRSWSRVTDAYDFELCEIKTQLN